MMPRLQRLRRSSMTGNEAWCIELSPTITIPSHMAAVGHWLSVLSTTDYPKVARKEVKSSLQRTYVLNIL